MKGPRRLWLGGRCFERVDLLTNTSLPPFDGHAHRCDSGAVLAPWLLAAFRSWFRVSGWVSVSSIQR